MHPGILNAKDLIDWKRKNGILQMSVPPERVIISSQLKFVRERAPRFFKNQIKGLSGMHICMNANTGLYLSGGWGIGAPALISVCEELHALGAKEFFLVGVCGRLSPEVQEGDVFLASTVIREEGTSFHYMPDDSECEIHAPGNMYLSKMFSEATFVSTDAPYRETAEKLEKWKKQGATLVDMETSALYAFSRFYELHTESVGIAADTIASGKWEMPKNYKFIERKQSEVIDKIMTVLK